MVCCFVFGCMANSNRQKVHLFKLPVKASEEVKQKWSRYIPKRSDRKWNFQTCRLCHKHFEDKFVIKTSTVTHEGKVIAEEPRERWTLSVDAYPTLFNNESLPFYFNRYNCQNARRSPRKRDAVRHIAATKKAKLTKIPEAPSVEFPITNESITRIELPIGWSSSLQDRKFSFHKLCKLPKSDITTFQAEREILVIPGNIPEIKLRGKNFVGIFQKPILSDEDFTSCITSVNSLKLCNGVRNFNMFNTFPSAIRVGNTLISTNCSQTVGEANQSCNPCKSLKRLLEISARKQMRRKQAKANPNHLKVPVKAKIKRLQTQKRNAVKSAIKLRKTVSTLKQTLRDLNKSFAIMKETTLERSIQEAENISPPFKLALLTAAKLQKCHSKHGMRYSADWILQSLLLKINSPKQYRYMRDNKILPLPNPHYLTTYLRGLPCQFGFNDFVFAELEQQYRNAPRVDRQVTLIFDEMKVREGIRFDGIKLKYFGFVDYGEFSSDYLPKSKKAEADHALVFMTRTINGKMTQPVGAFATRGSAPGNILAKMIVACILKLEKAKLEVVAVVCDGATSNKACWKYLGITGENGMVNNKIVNPVDEKRNIHFLCDIPHVFKCVRNNLHKQRFAKFQGTDVCWNFYQALYEADSQQGSDIRIVPKITYNHVNPGPFQKMVVCYATQVFSKSMADGLCFYRDVQKHLAFKESESTEKFTRSMNRLFDCGNARVPKEGLTSFSPNYLFIKEFLLSIQPGDNFAADVTMMSIRVTLQSILDIVDYLCNSVGYKYVLTAKLNQDCLEKFFGLLRSFGGDDQHPTITSFAHLYRLLSIYSPTAKRLRGNVRTDEEYSVSVVSYIDTLKTLRKSEQNRDREVLDEVEDEVLSKIIHQQDTGYQFLDEHNYANPSISNCLVYQLCGFLVFKSSSMTECPECISTLSDKHLISHFRPLTCIKDLGGLKHPCHALVKLIANVIEPKIINAIHSNITSSNIVNDVVKTIGEINCFGIGCSEEHSKVLATKLVIYYIIIRFYFHEKQRNKEQLKSTHETKRKRKQTRLC